MSMPRLTRRLNRTKEAIKIKATRLGLGGAKTNSCKYISARCASKILGIDNHTIISWIKKGLLKARFQAISRCAKIWCIDFYDFIEFLKNNQDLWNSTKVEIYALGSEEDWLLEKRKKDRVEYLNGRS